MLGRVSGALVGTGLADLGAHAAQGAVELAASSHEGGGAQAQVGAIAIQPYAGRHLGKLGFFQAGGGAVLAGQGATQACIDACGMVFMSHDDLLRGVARADWAWSTPRH